MLQFNLQRTNPNTDYRLFLSPRANWISGIFSGSLKLLSCQGHRYLRLSILEAFLLAGLHRVAAHVANHKGPGAHAEDFMNILYFSLELEWPFSGFLPLVVESPSLSFLLGHSHTVMSAQRAVLWGWGGFWEVTRVVSASLISANGSQALSSSTVTVKKHHEELISLMLKTCADAW